MRPVIENLPGFVIPEPGGPEVGRLTPAVWSPMQPDHVMVGFAQQIVWVPRDVWRVGTEAPCYCDRLQVFPVQREDVHWTVVQVQTPGLPVLRWYSQTFRVTAFVSRTYPPLPEDCAADLRALYSPDFDVWLADLAGAA